MAGANEVLIEDDDAGYVSYFPENAWDSWDGGNYHANSYHVTKVPGAYVTFVFDGSYVAYYSDKNYDHGNFSVFLDGRNVYEGSSYAPNLQIQLPLFSTSVQAGRHNLTIRNAMKPTLMGVDYFIFDSLPATPSFSEVPATHISSALALSAVETVSLTSPIPDKLPEVSASLADPPSASSPSTSPPSTSAPSSSQTQIPAAATTRATTNAIVGAVCGVLLALIAVIGITLLVARRRRSRRKPPADASVVDALPLPPPYSQSETSPISLVSRGKVRLDALGD